MSKAGKAGRGGDVSRESGGTGASGGGKVRGWGCGGGGG